MAADLGDEDGGGEAGGHGGVSAAGFDDVPAADVAAQWEVLRMEELAALPHPPLRMVVTLQREVADRMAAAPSTADYGWLGILLQRHYAVSIVNHISRNCFWPPPEVQSTVRRLEWRSEGERGTAEEAESSVGSCGWRSRRDGRRSFARCGERLKTRR